MREPSPRPARAVTMAARSSGSSATTAVRTSSNRASRACSGSPSARNVAYAAAARPSSFWLPARTTTVSSPLASVATTSRSTAACTPPTESTSAASPAGESTQLSFTDTESRSVSAEVEAVGSSRATASPKGMSPEPATSTFSWEGTRSATAWSSASVVPTRALAAAVPSAPVTWISVVSCASTAWPSSPPGCRPRAAAASRQRPRGRRRPRPRCRSATDGGRCGGGRPARRPGRAGRRRSTPAR